ncbi:MAG: hypothetical protein ABSF67_12325 [Roseiarcus sp.]|jgi:hypothetical protein
MIAVVQRRRAIKEDIKPQMRAARRRQKVQRIRMPRPYPPAPISPLPMAEPFPIGDRESTELAHVLKVPHLPPELCGMISHAIGCYRATEAGSKDTTIANTLAALDELSKSGRPYNKAVKRLADDRSALDYTTHERLQPLAKAVLKGEPGSQEALAQESHQRAKELRAHKRVSPPIEVLRHFCGVLHMIFNNSGSPALNCGLESERWRQCRIFAMEVFAIAGIDHDFGAHPERLTEYLGTDVSIG